MLTSCYGVALFLLAQSSFAGTTFTAHPSAFTTTVTTTSFADASTGLAVGRTGATMTNVLISAVRRTTTTSPTTVAPSPPLSRDPVEVVFGGCAYDHYPNTGCGGAFSTSLSRHNVSTPERCGVECSNSGNDCIGYRWVVDDSVGAATVLPCQLRRTVSITTALTAPLDPAKACYIKLEGDPADGRCLTHSPTVSPTAEPTTAAPTTAAPTTAAPTNAPTNVGDTYAPTGAPTNTDATDRCLSAVNTSAIDQVRMSHGHSASQVATDSAWEAACWNEGCYNPATAVASCKSNCACISPNGCSGGSCCDVCLETCQLACEQYYLVTTDPIIATDSTSDSTLSTLAAKTNFSEDSNPIFHSESTTLAISNGCIVWSVEPAFAPFPLTKYSISIPAEIDSIGISAVCSDPLATIMCRPGNDSPPFDLVSSSQPISVAGARRAGLQQIALVVTGADNASSTTYTIDIVRLATADESETLNLVLYLMLGLAILLLLMILILCGYICYRQMPPNAASLTNLRSDKSDKNSQKRGVQTDTGISKDCSSADLIEPKDLLEIALRSIGELNPNGTSAQGTGAGTEEHIDRVDSALLRDECIVELEVVQLQDQPRPTSNGAFFSFSKQVQLEGVAEEAATATQVIAREAVLAKVRADALADGKVAARSDEAATLGAQDADQALEVVIDRHNAQHHSQTYGSRGCTHRAQAKRSQRARSGLQAVDSRLNGGDENGPLTEKELAAVHAQIHRQFQRTDYNNDGAITFDEFSHIGNKEQFKHLDANGDGVISEQELMDRFFPFQNDKTTDSSQKISHTPLSQKYKNRKVHFLMEYEFEHGSDLLVEKQNSATTGNWSRTVSQGVQNHVVNHAPIIHDSPSTAAVEGVLPQ